MHIERVELSDFRNYRTLSFRPAPELNILTGPNAQGKTNLLEGLGVLLVGRSFRGAKAAELPCWESGGARVSGELRRGEAVRAVQRTVAQREDGRWGIAGEGCPWARAIAFAWQDLAILTEGPPARRNFVDGFAGKLYAAHRPGLIRYRQILARRNHLLQSGLTGTTLAAALAPWNEQLARAGTELVGRRRAAVDALEQEVRRLYPLLADRGVVRIEYCAARPAPAGSGEFVAALEARLGEEIRRGQTLVGPHRDDLLLEVDARDVRRYGSRGQQRLMALTLRLAEMGPVASAVGSAPILLLDDALSELDPMVQARVLQHVATAGQIFLTTADGVLPEVRGATWWEVNGGSVSDPRPVTMRGAA